MIRNWRNRSSNASRENQNHRHAIALASTLPNNFSFSFKNRQVNNRNALRRHFDLPHSSVIQSDNDVKMHQNSELEMHAIGSSINSNGYKSSSDGLSKAHSYQVKAEKLKCEDVEKITTILKHNNKKLNCKYKVVFKSHSNNHGTTLIVNAKRTEKNIPRCSAMNDLRSVGTTSTSLTSSSGFYMKGTHSSGRHDKFHSVGC